MGLYLYDAFGNLELLYRDPDISSSYPIPLVARPRPNVQASVADWQGAQEGRFLVQDVHRGLEPVPRGSIKRLRVVGVPPKVQPHMNNPVLGVSAEDPGKYILGTVPVEADGSVHFRVPSGVPVFFQALNEEGLAVQTMRSLTYTLPGQTLACVGCHEHRDAAPPSDRPALASLRPASKLTPAPSGSWPLRFDHLVQPVLDQHCVSCHSPGGKEADAAKLNLTATNAWTALINFGGGDLKKQAFMRDRSLPNQGTASGSRLWRHLTQPGGHQAVKLTIEDRERLLTWLDTYAHRLGHFSEAQEEELKKFRMAMKDLLEEPVRLAQ
jgi:cytochrome c553